MRIELRSLAVLAVAAVASLLSGELMRHGRLALEAGELGRALESAELAQFLSDEEATRLFVERCRAHRGEGGGIEEVRTREDIQRHD